MRNIPKALQIGLVGWWDSAGKDLSGNGNHGTLVNGPTKVRRLQNDGLNYNGTNQSLETTSPAFGEVFTVSCWINTTRTGTEDLFFDTGVLSTTSRIFMSMNYVSNGVIRFFGQTLGGAFGAIYPTVNPNTNDGKWHLITWTRDGSNNNIMYIDCKPITVSLQNGGIPATSLSSANVHIGTSNIGTNYYLGKVIYPMIWNRALSQKEIEMLYVSTFIK